MLSNIHLKSMLQELNSLMIDIKLDFFVSPIIENQLVGEIRRY